MITSATPNNALQRTRATVTAAAAHRLRSQPLSAVPAPVARVAELAVVRHFLASPVNVTEGYVQALTRHYSRQFGVAETLQWTRGPVQSLPTGFRVLRFPPASPSRLFTCATCGMGASGGAEAVECFLLSPVPDESQVELLTVIAWYHATTARLGIGHTVNFGRAWMPDSDCTYGLLSLPYLHGPSLEHCDHSGGRTQVLWLIPITPEERAFKVLHGLEALESRFEAFGFDYASPHRPSVLTPSESTGNA